MGVHCFRWGHRFSYGEGKETGEKCYPTVPYKIYYNDSSDIFGRWHRGGTFNADTA